MLMKKRKKNKRKLAARKIRCSLMLRSQRVLNRRIMESVLNSNKIVSAAEKMPVVEVPPNYLFKKSKRSSMRRMLRHQGLR